MKRITPRTCLWPVTFTLLGTFALSIGLTYRSDHHCYAGTCGEWLFPLQARLHVVVWYLWVSLSVAALAVRAHHPSLRHILQHHLIDRKLPILGKHLNISSLLIIGWIICLYGAATGIWWVRLRDYFEERGVDGGVFDGNGRLAAIALTGHYCDITMGMVLLPISRHSALASFFKLSASTTLAFHMIQAYTLFTLVLIHGLLYVAWVSVFDSLSTTLRRVYPVLNPTYVYHEVWPGSTSSLGIWRASLPFTGLFTTTIMLLIFITTFPAIRKRSFNVFYFTHLTVIVAVIVICLHASTMFYITAPGLVLWIVDWSMRVYELWDAVDGRVTTIGKGYYVLDMPMKRNRLEGCACTSPLAHFYIYHSESSLRELHPFTTITHLASENTRTDSTEDDLRIQFLFRKRSHALDAVAEPITEKKGSLAAMKALIRPKKKRKVQWTEKLASKADDVPTAVPAVPVLAKGSPVPAISPTSSTSSDLPPTTETVPDTDQTDPEKGPLPMGGILTNNSSRKPSITAFAPTHQYPIIPISLRLEGPYFTPAEPSRYNTVICLVAGTGISGGIAIANAFVEMERQRSALALSGAKDTDYDQNWCGPEGCGNNGNSKTRKCMAHLASSPWTRCVLVWSVREEEYIQLSFLQGHLSKNLEVQYYLTGKGRKRLDFKETVRSYKATEGRTWVYLSGPNLFIMAGEKACSEVGVDFYGARWEI